MIVVLAVFALILAGFGVDGLIDITDAADKTEPIIRAVVFFAAAALVAVAALETYLGRRKLGRKGMSL